MALVVFCWLKGLGFLAYTQVCWASRTRGIRRFLIKKITFLCGVGFGVVAWWHGKFFMYHVKTMDMIIIGGC